ncbi:MAG: efflux RND transporter periplasmic adaptor subunit [Pseudomonadota bacterium]
MRLSTSVKIALGIFFAALLYFGVSMVLRPGGSGDPELAADTEAERFIVATTPVAPQQWRDTITVRGRTEALRKVTVRAETPGVVAETPATLGAIVKEGDVLCRLKTDARQAALNEARAQLAKAKLDYDAAVKLAKDGFRSETSVAAAKAALDLAKAGEEQARLNLEKINIAAPFDGVFDQRMIEVGDFMGVGEPCGVVIQRSPYLVSGSVSERDVSKVAIGDAGVARLSTGEVIEGKVRFVASAANPATRTFKVELEIPNEGGALKDGVTADFQVFAARRDAHLVPRSSLLLDDTGRISVRTVNGDDRVETFPVSILGEEDEGVWINGLEGRLALITRGQDFVSAGQQVKTVEQTEQTSEAAL